MAFLRRFISNSIDKTHIAPQKNFTTSVGIIDYAS